MLTTESTTAARLGSCWKTQLKNFRMPLNKLVFTQIHVFSSKDNLQMYRLDGWNIAVFYKPSQKPVRHW